MTSLHPYPDYYFIHCIHRMPGPHAQWFKVWSKYDLVITFMTLIFRDLYTFHLVHIDLTQGFPVPILYDDFSRSKLLGIGKFLSSGAAKFAGVSPWMPEFPEVRWPQVVNVFITIENHHLKKRYINIKQLFLWAMFKSQLWKITRGWAIKPCVWYFWHPILTIYQLLGHKWSMDIAQRFSILFHIPVFAGAKNNCGYIFYSPVGKSFRIPLIPPSLWAFHDTILSKNCRSQWTQQKNTENKWFSHEIHADFPWP